MTKADIKEIKKLIAAKESIPAIKKEFADTLKAEKKELRKDFRDTLNEVKVNLKENLEQKKQP